MIFHTTFWNVAKRRDPSHSNGPRRCCLLQLLKTGLYANTYPMSTGKIQIVAKTRPHILQTFSIPDMFSFTVICIRCNIYAASVTVLHQRQNGRTGEESITCVSAGMTDISYILLHIIQCVLFKTRHLCLAYRYLICNFHLRLAFKESHRKDVLLPW